MRPQVFALSFHWWGTSAAPSGAREKHLPAPLSFSFEPTFHTNDNV